MDKTLPLITLVRMIRDFVYPEWDTYSKIEKIAWIDSYRKVEQESIEAIKRHGSAIAWYESGEGRLIDFPTLNTTNQ